MAITSLLLKNLQDRNDAANGSCALRVDEVRDRGSPSRESHYASQGLLVTRRNVQLTQSTRFMDVIEPALRLRVARGLAGTKRYHRRMIIIYTSAPA